MKLILRRDPTYPRSDSYGSWGVWDLYESYRKCGTMQKIWRDLEARLVEYEWSQKHEANPASRR